MTRHQCLRSRKYKNTLISYQVVLARTKYYWMQIIHFVSSESPCIHVIYHQGFLVESQILLTCLLSRYLGGSFDVESLVENLLHQLTGNHAIALNWF
jgi:hypothetical protein